MVNLPDTDVNRPKGFKVSSPVPTDHRITQVDHRPLPCPVSERSTPSRHSFQARLSKVCNNPQIPRLSADRESPAIIPPPMSEVVLMSAGISPSAGFGSRAFRFFCASSKSDPMTPPRPYQKTGSGSKKPPNEDAYGLGMMTESRTKSVARPVRPPLANC